MVLSWGHWRAAALMVARLCPKGKRHSALSVLTKPVMPIATLILCAALAAGQALPTCAPRPAGQDRLPGFRLAAGQRRASGRHSGNVADVPTCAGLVKIGCRPAGLADVRPHVLPGKIGCRASGLPPGNVGLPAVNRGTLPTCAGLVKIGRHSGELPGFRFAAGQCRASGRHSGSAADVPTCAGLVKIGLPPRRACRRAPHAPAGQDRLPGWSRSAVTRERCRASGLLPGNVGLPAVTRGTLPTCRRAPGWSRSVAAPPGLPTCAPCPTGQDRLPGFRFAAGQCRASGRHSGSAADVPTCAGLVKIGLPPRRACRRAPMPRRASGLPPGNVGLPAVTQGALPTCRRAPPRPAGQDRLPGFRLAAPRYPVLSVASDLLSCADLCNAVH